MKDLIYTVEAKMPSEPQAVVGPAATGEWTMLKRCPTLEDAKNYVEFQRLTGLQAEMKIVKMEVDLVTVETFPFVPETFPFVPTSRSGG